jgi:hypothetical protein
MKKLLLIVPLLSLLLLATINYNKIIPLLTYKLHVPIWAFLLYTALIFVSLYIYWYIQQGKHNVYKVGQILLYDLVSRKVAIVKYDVWRSNLYYVRLADGSITKAHVSALHPLIYE